MSEKSTPEDLLAITSNWPQTNARRVALIAKEAAKTITADEKQELDGLQRLADARIKLLAPVPVKELEDALRARKVSRMTANPQPHCIRSTHEQDELAAVDVEKIPSAVLRRLIEEVRTGRDDYGPRAYDRWHRRHNRS